MKNLHLTRYAAMASIALMGTTSAWGADETGWSLESDELTLFSGRFYSELSISQDNVSSKLSNVKVIIVSRDADTQTYSTLMLPADVKVSEAIDYNLYKYPAYGPEGMVEAAYYPKSYNPETFTLDMQSTDEIKANTPYIVKVSENTKRRLTFRNESGYTIVPTGGNEHATTLGSTCWQFTGSYVQNSWESAESLYGFDAADGVFVKALSATIYPMRAYLTCKNASPVYGLGKVAAEETLPDVIKVRFLDKDGGTLSIGKMNTRTGDIQMQDRYYDLKGRKLNGKPQNKIMYVNKKVIKH